MCKSKNSVNAFMFSTIILGMFLLLAICVSFAFYQTSKTHENSANKFEQELKICQEFCGYYREPSDE